jgi:RNA polymerase sigma-70 factor (ECF subfamily)
MKPRRSLNADERALLESLLRDVGPRVFAYVRKAFGGQIDAEEIVAETFARAADNVETLWHHSSKDLYLLAVARNLCRDTFRRRRPQAIPDEQLGCVPAHGADPHERPARQEEHQRLRAAIARLPDAQREVVVLRLSAGLKFEEIADLLKIPVGTALSRMDAATRKLRAGLGYTHACKRA